MHQPLTHDPTSWRGFEVFHIYKYSGDNLIEEVKETNPTLVIDVGCGHNRFKGSIPNLIGFDIAPFPNADMVSPISEAPFQPECCDVAMCLGSVQFGTFAEVISNLERVVSWVKPGGYIVMRTNQWPAPITPEGVLRHTWTEQDVQKVSQLLDLELYKPIRVEDVIGNRDKFPPELLSKKGITGCNRLVWWWKKPGVRTKAVIDKYTHELNLHVVDETTTSTYLVER